MGLDLSWSEADRRARQGHGLDAEYEEPPTIDESFDLVAGLNASIGLVFGDIDERRAELEREMLDRFGWAAL
jgi:hypothetical protein